MFECKICDKNLYNKISFSNIFQSNYEVHQECIDELIYNYDEEVIPIDGNTVIYDYVFKKLKGEFKQEYLWFYYFGKVLEKYMMKKDWSIVIINDKNMENFIDNCNPYLVFNLSKFPIIIISLEEDQISYLERL